MSYTLCMMIAIWILVGLAVTLTAILAVTLRLDLRLSSDVKSAKLLWGPITVVDSSRPKKSKSKAKEPTTAPNERELVEQSTENARKKSKRPPVPFRQRLAGITRLIRLTPELISALARFCIRTLSKVHVSEFSGKFRGGTGDPALTGALGGWMSALSATAPSLASRVAYQPDFLEERLRYDIRASFSFRPLSALAPTLRLIRETPIRETYRAFRLLRRGKKHPKSNSENH